MARKLRVVFDTNIFISAIIFGGNSRFLLEMAREKEFELYTSKSILFELSEKLFEKFDWKSTDVEEVISAIGSFAKIVNPRKRLKVIKKDLSDNRILECAQASDADFIITGDKKHILPLKKFKKTKIISPSDFIIHETN